MEILADGKPVIVNYYDTLQNGYTPGEFAYASIDVANLMCQDVAVRVVSNAGPLSGQNVFIAVGNFYQSDGPYQTPGILVNSTVAANAMQ